MLTQAEREALGLRPDDVLVGREFTPFGDAEADAGEAVVFGALDEYPALGTLVFVPASAGGGFVYGSATGPDRFVIVSDVIAAAMGGVR